MFIHVESTPTEEDREWVHQRLIDFNRARFEVSQSFPVAVFVDDDDGVRQGGLTGRTFGNWLMIEYFWLAEDTRGQGYGSKLLAALEQEAIQRGCRFAMLDTLDFQAKPFYEKQGYRVVYTMDAYPQLGKRHYMVKEFAVEGAC
ncbi:hypothetical protein WH50_04975 [Pokkaliibacter plantistimulans]|uniref:N-acetyltransferase domain-containing protein n=1 Tax=Pokkaliibacter plantistimulans TaxID=1635171 RepID=A0ABX5M3Y0_9GAMM|nr:GNAT family N-acetyltransferase [Pokkaliibacter plantistimulans]PXF32271.1 hypothetical protein WH50_04975 [Pokkaliibacter plantistimulans]